MPRGRTSCSLVVAALLGLSGAAGAGPDEPAAPLLSRLLDPSEPQHAQALEAWQALGPVERALQAQAALLADDAGLARAGAVAADPLTLDLAGLARLSAALAQDPFLRLTPPSGLAGAADDSFACGCEDLPALWRAVAEREPSDGLVGYSRLHRVLRHRTVPALAPLLARAKPLAFQALLWDLVNQAEGTLDDTNEAVYVEVLRYALARLDAEEQRRPPPAWGSLRAPVPREGLPASFLELARATWGRASEGFGRAHAPQAGDGAQQAAQPTLPERWLSAWARRLTPGLGDLGFLLELAQWPRAPAPLRWWAARHLASGHGREGGRLFQQALAVPGECPLFTAAEAAVAGRPEAWQRLAPAASAEDRGVLEALRWRVDPAAAEELSFEALRAGQQPAGVEAEERSDWAFDTGLGLPAAALEGLLRRVRAATLAPAVELSFFAGGLPEAFTSADAERIVSRWAEREEREPPIEGEPLRDLALLEVRAPAGVRALLRRWAEAAADDTVRARLHEALARLADAALLPAMLASWEDWPEPSLLGRVHDPRVEAFLRERAASSEVEIESSAVQGLALLQGLPEPLAGYLSSLARRWHDPQADGWAEAKALVLAGDALGAVLARLRSGRLLSASPVQWFAGFGLVRDPRAAEALRAWARSGTSGLVWPATAALALQGDAAARAAWAEFLAQARTFLLDHLQDPVLFTLDGDPAFVAAWVERLDENCCYAWHADEVLRATFPTLPAEHLPGDGGRARYGAQRWFAAHAGALVRSRLIDGWVPGPR